MKKITLLFIISLMISGAVSAKEKSASGSWLLTKVEEKGKSEVLNARVIFKEDGYAEWGGRVFGKWEQNKKIFTIESEMIKEFSAEWKISKFKNDELILTKPGTQLFFVRFDETKVKEANKNSGLEGVWKVDEVIRKAGAEIAEEAVEEVVEEVVEESGSQENSKPKNIEIETTVIFTLPYKVKIISKDEYGSGSSSGSWMYNQSEKSIVIMVRDELLGGEKQVVKLTGTELVFEGKNATVKATKVEHKKIEIERLTFEDNDFYDENGDFDFYAGADKLPWRSYENMIEKNLKVSKLVYDYSTLISDTEFFDTKELTAVISASEDEFSLEIDDIFEGYDRNNLPSGWDEINKVKYDDNNLLFPFEDEAYRIVGQEEITTQAGTFTCTVVETSASWKNIKLWMINDKPGILAKVIIDNTTMGKYNVFELVKIIY